MADASSDRPSEWASVGEMLAPLSDEPDVPPTLRRSRLSGGPDGDHEIVFDMVDRLVARGYRVTVSIEMPGGNNLTLTGEPEIPYVPLVEPSHSDIQHALNQADPRTTDLYLRGDKGGSVSRHLVAELLAS